MLPSPFTEEIKTEFARFIRSLNHTNRFRLPLEKWQMTMVC